MNKLLCNIGIHNWEERPIAEYKTPGGTGKLVSYGDVCTKCCKHRASFDTVVDVLPDKGNWRKINYETQI